MNRISVVCRRPRHGEWRLGQAVIESNRPSSRHGVVHQKKVPFVRSLSKSHSGWHTFQSILFHFVVTGNIYVYAHKCNQIFTDQLTCTILPERDFRSDKIDARATRKKRLFAFTPDVRKIPTCVVFPFSADIYKWVGFLRSFRLSVSSVASLAFSLLLLITQSKFFKTRT